MTQECRLAAVNMPHYITEEREFLQTPVTLYVGLGETDGIKLNR